MDENKDAPMTQDQFQERVIELLKNIEQRLDRIDQLLNRVDQKLMILIDDSYCTNKRNVKYERKK